MNEKQSATRDAGTPESGRSASAFPRACRFCGVVIESPLSAMAHLSSSIDCAKKANMAAVLMRMGIGSEFGDRDGAKMCQDMAEAVHRDHPELCPPPNADISDRMSGGK